MTYDTYLHLIQTLSILLTYTYIHMHTYTYTHTHIHLYIYTHTRIHTYTHTGLGYVIRKRMPPVLSTVQSSARRMTHRKVNYD
jgi:hypothetical protein